MDAVCLLADTYAKDSLLHAALVLSLIICLVTVVLLGIIVVQRKYTRVAIHKNLEVGFILELQPMLEIRSNFSDFTAKRHGDILYGGNVAGLCIRASFGMHLARLRLQRMFEANDLIAFVKLT